VDEADDFDSSRAVDALQVIDHQTSSTSWRVLKDIPLFHDFSSLSCKEIVFERISFFRVDLQGWAL